MNPKPISASDYQKLLLMRNQKDCIIWAAKSQHSISKVVNNDTAYVLKDNKMKSFITVKDKHGISKRTNKRLLANGFNPTRGCTAVVKKPMSLGQMTDDMLHHHLGPTVFKTHPVISLMDGSNNTRKNITECSFMKG